MITIKDNIVGLFGGVSRMDESKNPIYLNDFYLFNISKQLLPNCFNLIHN